MGTTLTGTTPQDTYDSLIKVTDNGPISATVKLLSDGLGNDSALALSTARVGIGTTSNYSFNDDAKLAVANTSGNSTISIVSGTASNGYLAFADGTTGTDRYAGSINYNHSTNAMTLHTNAGNERMIILSTGNVGIGLSAPTQKLEIQDAAAGAAIKVSNTGGGSAQLAVSSNATSVATLSFTNSLTLSGGVVSVSDGIQFPATQVASANANTLDDYEEGTWTMSLTFGGASVGVNYGDRTGTYTKIGRQVTATGYMSLSSKGSSTGAAAITGLPFTIQNSIPAYGVPSVRFSSVTFANQFFAESIINTTTIAFSEITSLGTTSSLTNADFADNSTIIVTLTYFV
jgi:hypothetical protein